MARANRNGKTSAANLGFEAKLWLAADSRSEAETSEANRSRHRNSRGIEADFDPEHADTFRRDLHPDLRADYVLANPPFNDSDWFRKDDDVRWQHGVPPNSVRSIAHEKRNVPDAEKNIVTWNRPLCLPQNRIDIFVR
jgi:hypothetical protein